MLELRNITKVFGLGTVTESTVFTDFSLSVQKGEFVSVVGSNGSGKTTLLNLLCGSIAPTAGEVCIGGKVVNRQKDFERYRTIGRVYQDPSLGTCPSLTVYENLSLADNKGKRFGLTSGVNKKRLSYYKEQLAALGLGLEDKMNVRMGALSGGQRQAVALLMATLTPLDVLILDEHTAALDPRTAEIIMELTDRIVREKALTALMVTHNLRYAAEYGTRLLMLDKGQIVLDVSGEEKKNTTTESILQIFNRISIECGN